MEAFNKVVKRSLAMLIAQHGKSWVHYIKPLAFSFRHAPLAWAGISPFEICFGFQGTVPVDLLTASPHTIKSNGERFHASHLARLSETWQFVERRQIEYEKKMVGGDVDDQNFDVYAEGSWCIAWLPTKLFGSHAFVTHWKGPFLIERRLSTKVYRLREPTTGKVFQVNVDNLRHFKRRADIMQRYPRVDPPIQSDHWAESASVADLSEPDLRRFLERSEPEVPLNEEGLMRGEGEGRRERIRWRRGRRGEGIQGRWTA